MFIIHLPLWLCLLFTPSYSVGSSFEFVQCYTQQLLDIDATFFSHRLRAYLDTSTYDYRLLTEVQALPQQYYYFSICYHYHSEYQWPFASIESVLYSNNYIVSLGTGDGRYVLQYDSSDITAVTDIRLHHTQFLPNAGIAWYWSNATGNSGYFNADSIVSYIPYRLHWWHFIPYVTYYGYTASPVSVAWSASPQRSRSKRYKKKKKQSKQESTGKLYLTYNDNYEPEIKFVSQEDHHNHFDILQYTVCSDIHGDNISDISCDVNHSVAFRASNASYFLAVEIRGNNVVHHGTWIYNDGERYRQMPYTIIKLRRYTQSSNCLWEMPIEQRRLHDERFFYVEEVNGRPDLKMIKVTNHMGRSCDSDSDTGDSIWEYYMAVLQVNGKRMLVATRLPDVCRCLLNDISFEFSFNEMPSYNTRASIRLPPAITEYLKNQSFVRSVHGLDSRRHRLDGRPMSP